MRGDSSEQEYVGNDRSELPLVAGSPREARVHRGVLGHRCAVHREKEKKLENSNGLVGLTYDVTINFGKDDDNSEMFTIEDVTKIEGYGNEVQLTGDQVDNHRCLNAYEMMVSFFRADGALVASFPRGQVRAIVLSPTE